MSTKIRCPSCHKQVEEDSSFCRYCGQRIPKVDEDRQIIVNRTADFSDIDGALKAINDYFTQWPHEPETRDLTLTLLCIGLVINRINIEQGKFKADYQDIARVAEVASQGLPTYLVNGMVISARVHDKEKRDEILTNLTNLLNIFAHPLQQLYEAAEKESQSLLVDGKTQAQIKHLTKQESYREAEVYYASYEKGEFDAAVNGFTYLKELNPLDAYFRNVLGSVLLRQGKPLPALQEYLFGLSLDPGDVKLTSNTLRCICGLRLFPAAVEVARHYEKIGGDPDEPTVRPWACLARALTTAAVMKHCTPDDISPTASDLIDEFEVIERPWLKKPESFTDSKNVLRDARVFISYRRSGGINYAERLERMLKGAYPSMHVFRDQTFLFPGEDFVDQLREEIDKADVFLALIDQNWTEGKGKNSRLHDQKGILRREVARAFSKQMIVIPVLLEKAHMPSQNDLPSELHKLSHLQAQRLAEASFENDFKLLELAMIRLLMRKKAINEELEELDRLMEEDPAAYNKALEQIFEAGRRVFPEYVKWEASQGKGVAIASVGLQGDWECIATEPEGRVTTLRFTTETIKNCSSFLGEICVEKSGLERLFNREPEEIKGTWKPVIDPDKELLLGIYLDGLKSGIPFKLFVPFDRRLGKDLVGTDTYGVTYSSRNVQPIPF